MGAVLSNQACLFGWTFCKTKTTPHYFYYANTEFGKTITTEYVFKAALGAGGYLITSY